MVKEKVVLAYSGGLDTSVAVKYLAEKYDMDVIAVTIDVGNEKDFTVIKEKAVKVGAIKCEVIDAKDMLVKYFLFPALQANALYEGQYPLATALTRPLMAKLLVDTAVAEGATAIAHGCTGKGNDQVRFEVGINSLAPQMKIIAPAREWGMTREELIAYAGEHGIPVPISKKSPYSIDECIWGRAIECGVLEDPWAEPPEDAYLWTVAPDKAPDRAQYIEIGFVKGIPVSLDGEELDGLDLIMKLHDIAGKHGIGRIDHIENRVVGIKSREVYEAPAAITLIKAHQGLEAMNLSKDQLRFKQKVETEIADLIYNGMWFSQHNRDLSAYIMSSQHYITGTVRMKLYKGSATVVGRKSPWSLYNLGLATYEKGDTFNQKDAEGFIKLWGLSAKTQAQTQLLGDTEGPLSIIGPPEPED
ncbi:MAG: argininosuccinate synthase [Dehalococcoidales bacterium]|nr:argininosuccinate synthase [Dehalococcoidales bacterium]